MIFFSYRDLFVPFVTFCEPQKIAGIRGIRAKSQVFARPFSYGLEIHVDLRVWTGESIQTPKRFDCAATAVLKWAAYR